MNTRHIALVQESWERLLRGDHRSGELFYRRLFELDPSLAPLFRGDLAEQGCKLMAMIDLVVLRLEHLDQLVPTVQDLGRRHTRYGVADADYETVGRALLDTLRGGLGGAMSRELVEAWRVAYTTLATVMKQASAELRAATHPEVGRDGALAHEAALG